MDDLLVYLRHEIAMDGDDGTTSYRLDAFVQAFYEQRAASEPSSSSVTSQNVDASFREFVWKQLVSLPEVKVACLRKLEAAPQMALAAVLADERGESVDGPEAMEQVPIQDQGKFNLKNKSKIKAARKDKGKHGRDARLTGESWEFCELASDEVEESTRQQLVERYGVETLRLAVDPETSFVALTGSHERKSKLTHLSYQVLQAIARGREAGKTVIELGQEFDHDQKSLFHFVRNLVEMGFIVKIKVLASRAQTSRCIHRHYLETSPHWATWMTRDPDITGNKDNDDEEEEDTRPTQLSILTTTHLNSNEPLVRSRILHALRRAPDNTIIHANLVFAIGFQSRPDQMNRRRLNRIVTAMVAQNLVEKVGIEREGSRALLGCIRLTDYGLNHQPRNQMGDLVELDEQRPNILRTLPVERQIMDLLVQAGSRGATISDLRAGLGDLNKRIIETILVRYEKNPEPPHLCDFRIQSVLETEGREKRLRWFTVSGYHERCRLDGLSDLYDPQDFSHPELAGGYSALETTGFYRDAQAFHRYAATTHTGGKEQQTRREIRAKAKGKSKGARSKAAKGEKPVKKTKHQRRIEAMEKAVAAGEATQEELDKLRAEPPRQRGRPRKEPQEPSAAGEASGEPKAKPPRKRKAAEVVEGEGTEGTAEGSENPPPKKRRTARKDKKEEQPKPAGTEGDGGTVETQTPSADGIVPDAVSVTEAAKPPARKRKSRAKPKEPQANVAEATPDAEAPSISGEAATNGDSQAEEPQPKKKKKAKRDPQEPGPNGTPPPPPIRGRPRKYPPGTTAVERKRMLEERRLAGLEPLVSKLAQTKAARAAAAAAAVAGLPEPPEGSSSAASNPAATPSTTRRTTRKSLRKVSTLPSDEVTVDGGDHNISVDASGEEIVSTPEVTENKEAIERDLAEEGTINSVEEARTSHLIEDQAAPQNGLLSPTADPATDLAGGALAESITAAEGAHDIAVDATAFSEGRDKVMPTDAALDESSIATLLTSGPKSTQPIVATGDASAVGPLADMPSETYCDDANLASNEVTEISDGLPANLVTSANTEPTVATNELASDTAVPAQNPSEPQQTVNDTHNVNQTFTPVTEDIGNPSSMPFSPDAPPIEGHAEASRPEVNTSLHEAAPASSDTLKAAPILWLPEQVARLAALLPDAVDQSSDATQELLNYQPQSSSLATITSQDLSGGASDANISLPPMPDRVAIAEPQLSAAQLAALPAMPVALKKQTKAVKPVKKAGTRNKPAKAERINYSIHTHENEYHKVLQEQGGVVDSKAYEKAWQQWMFRKNGTEPYQLDRRTLSTVWNGLEKRGLVKRTTIQIEGTGGKLLQKAIFLLAELEMNSSPVIEFIAKLQEQENAAAKNWLVGRRKITDSGKFRNAKSRTKRSEGASPNVNPREFFALEWEAVAQSYGWYYGAFARARALHKFLVTSVVDDNDSSYIMSSSEDTRIFATPFVLFETPLSVFLHISAFQEFSEELDALLSQQASDGMPIKDVPASITSCFRQTKGRPNLRFAPLFNILSSLGLLSPLEPVDTATSIVAFSGAEREPRYFKERASKGASYWKLANEVPIYDAFASDPEARSLLGALPVSTLEQVDQYWDVLQRLHAQNSDIPVLSPPARPYPERFVAADMKDFAGRGSVRWKDDYFLLRSQKSYIRRIMGEREERSSLLDDPEAMGQLAFNVCAPIDTVRDYIEKQLKGDIDVLTPRKTSARRQRSKAAAKDSGHSESSESDNSPQVSTRQRKARKQRVVTADRASPVAEEPSAILARKAKDNRKEKLSIFKAIIERFASEHGQQSVPTDQLGFLQEWFIAPDGLTAEGLRSHLETEVGIMPVLQPAVFATGRTLDTRSKTLKPKTKATKMKRMPKIKAERAGGGKKKAAVDRSEPADGDAPLQADSDEESGAEHQIVLPPLPPVEISNEKKSAAYGWNAAEDEQLRDFYVILYSRAAQLGTKFNIDPAKRYYPGCTGKLLLDRLRRCVSHHGDGPYFDALQQAWTDIWLKHRGKARLPDPHPRDYANFDLHAHRSYLCAKINKQSIRFQAMMPSKATDDNKVLPYDVDELETSYNVPTNERLSNIHAPNAWDYLWSTITAAQKAKEYYHRSFLLSYSYEEEELTESTSQGRVQKFAQKYSFESTLEDTVRQTAAAFEKRLSSDKELEWSLLAEDGDMLAIATMFSNNLLDFKLDTSVTLEGRPYTDYRTRKIDDESFENAVTITVNQAYKDLKKPIFEM